MTLKGLLNVHAECPFPSTTAFTQSPTFQLGIYAIQFFDTETIRKRYIQRKSLTGFQKSKSGGLLVSYHAKLGHPQLTLTFSVDSLRHQVCNFFAMTKQE